MASNERTPRGRPLWAWAIAGLAIVLATTAHADLAPEPRPAPPAPKAVKLPTEKATRLADGLYIGPVVGMATPGEFQVTVVRGFIVEAYIRRSGEGLVPFDLGSVGVSNAAGIRLQGSAGNEFIRVSGEIIDAERGRGTFEGVLVRKQVSGTWSVTRR